MPSSRVSLTFTGSASPYTAGDVASFPMDKAKSFIRRGVAHFTNPELADREKSIKRVRLGEAVDRPHSIHGSVTSGKDFRSQPDEFDRAMSGGTVMVDAKTGETLVDKDGVPLDEALEDPGRSLPEGSGAGEGGDADPDTPDEVEGAAEEEETSTEETSEEETEPAPAAKTTRRSRTRL